MIPDGVLGQSAEYLVLLSTEALNPALHVFKHLALDLRIVVVEVGVEATKTDPMRGLH